MKDPSQFVHMEIQHKFPVVAAANTRAVGVAQS